MLKRGRSDPFVDPSLTALAAPHIWMPPAGQSILTASAERAHPSDREALFFPKLPAVEHILIDPAGHQHVLLRGNDFVLQLEIEGADIVKEPVKLTIVAGGPRMLGQTVSQLAVLRRILSKRPVRSPLPSWPARTLNRRDSLIVFDCMTAGSSEREAGVILHGAEAVARDWRRASLRQRIRRDKLRAEEFIFGGYRELLK